MVGGLVTEALGGENTQPNTIAGLRVLSGQAAPVVNTVFTNASLGNNVFLAANNAGNTGTTNQLALRAMNVNSSDAVVDTRSVQTIQVAVLR